MEAARSNAGAGRARPVASEAHPLHRRDAALDHPACGVANRLRTTPPDDFDPSDEAVLPAAGQLRQVRRAPLVLAGPSSEPLAQVGLTPPRSAAAPSGTAPRQSRHGGLKGRIGGAAGPLAGGPIARVLHVDGSFELAAVRRSDHDPVGPWASAE